MEKISQLMWATSAIFKLPIKVNNRPMGENSPNLVTMRPDAGDFINFLVFRFSKPVIPGTLGTIRNNKSTLL
jgi:hypothetical protein